MKTPQPENPRELLRKRLRQRINQKKLGRDNKKNQKTKVTKAVKKTLEDAGVNSTHFFEAMDIIQKATEKKKS